MRSKKALFVLLFSAMAVSCGGTSTSSSSVAPSASSDIESSITSYISSSDESSSEATSSAGPVTSSETSSSSTSIPDVEPITEVELKAAIDKGVSNASGVSEGLISIDQGSGEVNIPYEFGEDNYGTFLHYEEADWSGSLVDHYICQDAQGNIYPVAVSADGAISKDFGTYTLENIKGVEIETIVDNYTTYLGVENTVIGLYNNAHDEGKGQDLEFGFEDDIYYFSFGYYGSAWMFRTITVEFSLTETGVFDFVSISYDNYSNSSFVYDEELHRVQLNDGAEPSSSALYMIEQTEAERTAENPYDVADFAYNSFDLYVVDDNGDDVEEVTSSPISMQTGSQGSISVAIRNALPSTANTAFDAPTITVTSASVEDGIDARFIPISGSINIRADEAGTYTLEVKTQKVTKTISIVATLPLPSTMMFITFKEGFAGDGYISDVYRGSFDLYSGNTVYLYPTINPSDADQTFTYEVISGENANITISQETINVNSWTTRDTIAVTSSVVGSYTIRFTSALSTVYQDVVINVIETPTMASILSSRYIAKVSSVNKFAFDFVPGEGDGATGSVTISDMVDSTSGVYNYEVTPGEVSGYNMSLTLTSGTSLALSSIEISPNFDLRLRNGLDSYSMYVSSPQFLASGSWEGTDATSGLTFTLNLGIDGGFMYTAFNLSPYTYSSNEGDWTIAERTEGGYYINFARNAYTQNDSYITFGETNQSYISADYSTVYFSVAIDGNPVVVALTPSSDY